MHDRPLHKRLAPNTPSISPSLQTKGIALALKVGLTAGLSLGVMACGASEGEQEQEALADAGMQAGPDASPSADASLAAGCEKMDIVFVIDDSVSMQQEQDNLIANFPGFIEVLQDFETRNGLPLDYRVAVTTTGRDQRVGYDVQGFPDFVEQSGQNGAFVEGTDCGISEPWIEDENSDPAQAFACVADVGVGGPDIEMPLLALELAFGERVSDGTNAGFLRDDALLTFIVLTDEDDCSRTDNNFILGPPTYDCVLDDPALTSLSHFSDFFDSLAGGRDKWAGAVIAGPGPEDCDSDFGDAEPATRLRDFVDHADGNIAFSSICEGDLSLGLADALQRFGDACETFPSID